MSATDPYDAELMSEEVRQRLKAGEQLNVGSMKIPMVDLPLGATGKLQWCFELLTVLILCGIPACT